MSSNEQFPGETEKNEWFLQNKILKQLNVFEELNVTEQIALIDEIKEYFKVFPYVSPSDFFQEKLVEDYYSGKIEYDWPVDNPIMESLRDLAEYLSRNVIIFAFDSIKDPGTYEGYSRNIGWMDYKSIRLSLAGNKNTPPELLETIAMEEALDLDEFFPEVLANNPKSTAKVIEELVMKSTYERSFDEHAILAIKHPNTGSQLLLNLLDEDFRKWVNADFETEVLPVIVQHYNLPRENVIEFLDHENKELVLAANLNLAGRPDSSIEELAEFAINEDIQVRTAAFNNPNATEEIRASAALLGVNEGDDEGDE